MKTETLRTSSEGLKLSIILLDWSCRHSAHILDCLARQTVPRNQYEIIWVEYYKQLSPCIQSRITDACLGRGEMPIDIASALEMEVSICHHKHLLLNAGVLLARGPVVCFADSDAIVTPTFVQSITSRMNEPDIVLHLDEVRNVHSRFYPFANPSLSDITGLGSVNWVNGKPAGLIDRHDPLHLRNYGACMVARKEDIIAIGGADMHADYLGHICGPYEMTWRLVNAGKTERWHDSEWLYHVWHPGESGRGNHCGPHDGLLVSSRALKARAEKRIMPYVEHPAIAEARTATRAGTTGVNMPMMLPRWVQAWKSASASSRERTYMLGSSRIDIIEDGSRSSVRITRGVPFFGRRAGLACRLALMPRILRMMLRQLKVKLTAAGYNRRGEGMGFCRNQLRRIKALCGFVIRIYAYNRHWSRQCWLAAAYAAQERANDVVLYGQGDEVELLKCLASRLGVKISGIIPLEPGHQRLQGLDVLSAKDVVCDNRTVIVASFVGIDDMVEHLQAGGLPRGRIITLA